MRDLSELDALLWPALAGVCERLRHDLGRYIAMQSRFVAPGDDAATRRTALCDDLLATRRGPSITLDAAQVFEPAAAVLSGRAPLVGDRSVDLRSVPRVARLFRAMQVVDDLIGKLRAGELADAELDQAIASAIEASDACRTLTRHVLSIAREHG